MASLSNFIFADSVSTADQSTLQSFLNIWANANSQLLDLIPNVPMVITRTDILGVGSSYER